MVFTRKFGLIFMISILVSCSANVEFEDTAETSTTPIEVSGVTINNGSFQVSGNLLDQVSSAKIKNSSGETDLQVTVNSSSSLTLTPPSNLSLLRTNSLELFVGTSEAQSTISIDWNFDGVTVGSSGDVSIQGSLVVGTTTSDGAVYVKHTDASLKLQDSDNSSSHSIIKDIDGIELNIGKITDAGAKVSIDPKPADGTSSAQVEFFKGTNTTGSREVILYKGDGTSDISATISSGGGDSFVQNDGGNFGVGTNSPSEKLDVNGTVRASGFSSGVAWESGGTPLNSFVWTNFECRKVGELIMFRGYVSVTGDVTGWPYDLGYVPAACAPSSNIYFVSATCWENVPAVTTGCMVDITTTGKVRVYNNANFNNVNLTAIFPDKAP